MRNAGLEEVQTGIMIAGRNINNLRYAEVMAEVMAESYAEGYGRGYGRKQRRTKEPLDESERGECKSWLKAQHSEN